MAEGQPSPPPKYTEHRGHCLLPTATQQNFPLPHGFSGQPQYLVPLHEPYGIPQSQPSSIAQQLGSGKSAVPVNGPVGAPRYTAEPQPGEVCQQGTEAPPPYSNAPDQQLTYPTNPVVPPNYAPRAYPAHPVAPVHNVTNVVTRSGTIPVYAINQTTAGSDTVVLVGNSDAIATIDVHKPLKVSTGNSSAVPRLAIVCSFFVVKAIVVIIIIAVLNS